MQRKIRLISLILLLCLVCAVTVVGDNVTKRLESVVIDSFDKEGSAFFIDDKDEAIVWKLYGSKYSTKDFPKKIYVPNTWPIDLFGVEPEKAEELGVLGINGRFDRLGYNQIEIIPGKGTGDEWNPTPVSLLGRVQNMDFWIWGSQYDYNVEFHFMDYEGRRFRLIPYREGLPYPGSIKFTGWKNMTINIPGHIRQAQRYKPSQKALSLTKIVITTHPNENVENFYVYLDHLKILTDVQESFFDGSKLADPKFVEELWGGEGSSTSTATDGE